MSSEVRERLVEAAACLFGAEGVEGVSLREVNVAAATGNASAVQYHFGDRKGLVRAVLDRHRPAVEERRHALLDAYEAAGRDDMRALTAAFVRPLVSELATPAGQGYLQLLADLVNRPKPVLDPADIHDSTTSTSTNRWRVLLEPLMDPTAVAMHRRFLAMQFTFTELARRGRDRPGKDHQLFASHLIDLVTAMLAAPISEETARQLTRPRDATGKDPV
ncbi:TetR/AcrR family transcriptional regulator [Mycolicibacterium sp.]|uniref:TetR/AcrR family transcriptional regulator n=1 Tax=Mycolicibacterium sp. TaxID=2320850 RepID=UPI003D0A7FF9